MLSIRTSTIAAKKTASKFGLRSRILRTGIGSICVHTSYWWREEHNQVHGGPYGDVVRHVSTSSVYFTKNKKAVLSQGEQRNPAVNFDAYRILQRLLIICDYLHPICFSGGLCKTYLFCKSAHRPYKVIQGLWFWYESKARMRLHIISPL